MSTGPPGPQAFWGVIMWLCLVTSTSTTRGLGTSWSHPLGCPSRPHPPLKMLCWNSLGSSGFGRASATCSCSALQSTFSAPSSDVSVCWVSLWVGHRNLCSVMLLVHCFILNWSLIDLQCPVNYLEKAMVPHSSTLAWKIPWTEEPGGLQSMGSLRVGHDWVTSLLSFMHWRRKWQPTPVFLPGESQGRGSLVGCRLWGRTESDMNEAT